MTKADTSALTRDGSSRRADDSPTLTVYIEVDDVDAALATIEAAGGTPLTGRMPIPTVGWSAMFVDTEGNRAGVFQPDPDVPMPDVARGDG